MTPEIPESGKGPAADTRISAEGNAAWAPAEDALVHRNPLSAEPRSKSKMLRRAQKERD